MRAFFAIPMPDAARDVLLQAQRQLAGLEGVSWTPAANFHLTLAFLGEIDEVEAHAARTRLAEVAFEREPIRIDGLSAFPCVRGARVLWAGIAGAERQLAALALALRSPDPGIGAEPFVPHVTIGRARRAPVDAQAAIARVGGAVRSAAFPCAPIVLYESVRTPMGSRYRELARCE